MSGRPNPADVAHRILHCEGFELPELTSDEIVALAREYERLAGQRAPGDPGIAPPPADAKALRQAIEDVQDPPEDRQP
jgi:hypothetical protein